MLYLRFGIELFQVFVNILKIGKTCLRVRFAYKNIHKLYAEHHVFFADFGRLNKFSID